MERLVPEAIRQDLPTSLIGRHVRHYDQIGSTNAELRILAAAAEPEGLLLVAEEQRAGRGRLGRSWYAPPRSCLLTSLLFRPAFLPGRRVQQLTMICGLAAVEAIADQTGLVVDLKWPNDLLYQGRKLAGLLTEAAFNGSRLEWVVVGMGLNVNVDFKAESKLPTGEGAPLTETAISLQMILGQQVSRLALLRSYLIRVEERYLALRAGQSPFTDWAAKLVTLGRHVTVSGPGAPFQGLAESVDQDGALHVRRADGRLEHVLAADVTLS